MKKIAGVYDRDTLNFHRINQEESVRGQIYIPKEEDVPAEILVTVSEKRTKKAKKGIRTEVEIEGLGK